MARVSPDALALERAWAEVLSEGTEGVVVLTDPEGVIVHAGLRLARLCGMAEAVGLRGRAWPDGFAIEADLARLREGLRRAAAGELVVRQRARLLDHGGTESSLEWMVRPLHDREARVIGLLWLGLDPLVTRARRALLPSWQQDRFASVIASTQDAFILIDREAKILAFNAAAEQIFGYHAEEVVGHKVNVLMPEPYRGEHDAYIERYEQTGEARAIGKIRVVQGQRRSGETFPIELSVTRVGSEEEARYAAFIRDISETVRLRQRSAERQRLAAIGTTSAKFAHEVGNPLNGMLMNLQLLQRRIAKGAEHDKLAPLVDRVDHEVRRLAGLLDEFRSMSRRQTFQLKLTDPCELLRELVASHAEEYTALGVQVVLHCHEGLPRIHLDAQKLTQVLLNLAKNAVEAMSPDGGELRLSIRVDPHGDGVIIEVADDGPGIPEGTDVFEPFVTTKREGTGLGLAVARQIVAAHGGELVYRCDPGQGTTFVLRLPLDPPSQSGVSRPVVRP